MNGELDFSWRTAGKIGLGALTGVAIAALPGAPMSAFGARATGTIAGVSTKLIGNSIIAGAIAGTGSVIDQSIDVHSGYKGSVSWAQAFTNASITSLTFGIGGHFIGQAKYSAVHNRYRTLPHNMKNHPNLDMFIDKQTSLFAASVNSLIDITRSAIELKLQQSAMRNIGLPLRSA